MWHVTVQNVEESTFDAYSDEYGRIAYKFVIAPKAAVDMDPDQLEVSMQLELVKAIRSIKKEMIMKGMEP